MGGLQVLPRGLRVEAHRLTQRIHQLGEVLAVRARRPRCNRVDHGCVLVRDHQLLIDLQACAQAVTGRAGTVGRVEGERARLQLVQLDRVAIRAGHLLGEAARAVRVVIRQSHEVQDHNPVGQLQSGLDRIGQALLLGFLHLQAVHHHVNVVLDLLFQRRRIGQLINGTVDLHAGVALRGQVLEEVHELTLASAHDRREHLELQSLLHRQDLVHDLLRGLPLDHAAALRAVRSAGAGVQQAQVVEDLGYRADGRARVAVRGLLIDGHRRGQPFDQLHVRLIHAPEEHARIGAQRFDIPALAFREDRVEGQGRFTRAGQPRKHDHLVARQVDIHALEVVFAGSTDNQLIGHCSLLIC